MSQPGSSSGSGTNGGAHVGGVWGGIVINVVVGAEVATLCKLEEGCGVVIDEMPINVCAPSLKHPIWNLPISFTNKFENPVAEMVV
jgi:hypothetical protein